MIEKQERVFILYDGRACADQGTEDASVLVYCEDDEEARSYEGDYGQMACYSYELNDKKLTDEKWEWDYHG